MVIKLKFGRCGFNPHLPFFFSESLLRQVIFAFVLLQIFSPILNITGVYLFSERIESFYIEFSSLIIVLLSIYYFIIRGKSFEYTRLDLCILFLIVYMCLINLVTNGKEDNYLLFFFITIFSQLILLKNLNFSPNKIESGIFLVSSLLSIYIIIQQLFNSLGFPEIKLSETVFDSTTTTGNYLALTFPYILFRSSDKMLLAHKIFFLINLVAIFLSKDVSSIILVMLMCYLFFTFFYKRTKNLLCFKKHLLFHVLFLIISFSAIMTTLINSNKALRALEGRIFIQSTSMPMLKDNLLFGIGTNKFGAQYNYLQASYFVSEKDQAKYGKYRDLANNSFSCFNEYLELWIEIGIFGLILLLIVIFYIYRTIKYKPLKPAIISITVFFILSLNDGLFHNISLLPIMIINFCLMGDQYKNYTLHSRLVKIQSIVIVSLTLWYAYILTNQFKSTLAYNKTFSEATNSQKLRNYQRAYKYLQNDGIYLYHYGTFLIKKQAKVKEGIKILKKAISRLPHTDILNLLGDAYIMENKFTDAEYYYKISANIVPIKIIPRYKLFQLYILKGENDNAIKQAKIIDSTPVKVSSKTGDRIRCEITRYLDKQENCELKKECL
ncbi:hypothetical protein CA265_11795 [Sphingobacteriaceae bacterium GW460-11-11-14-LB5]|nr:hypothetical protein CA265_11795 [Sphingobacteriaceae bacterium GW460-11-11-14-LB5]